MPIARVTISLPVDLARRVKKAAGKKPVSAWLAKLIEDRLSDEEYERLLKEHFTDFPMTRAERRAGDEMFERLVSDRPRRRRRAA